MRGCTNVQVCFDVIAEDWCGLVTPVVTPPSCSYFPVGTTPVVVSATDACGNSNACVFTVTVLPDTNAPVVKLCPTNLIVCATNKCGPVPDFTTLVQASDDSGSVTIIQSVPPGTVICDPTPVTFYITDACGNMALCQTVLLPEICCYRPPDGMALWLTFDEAAGVTCLNSMGGNNGLRYMSALYSYCVTTKEQTPVMTAHAWLRMTPTQ